jgi:hypothetical protein
MAIAAVQDPARSAGEEMLDRADVRIGQIAEVDEVTQAGAVRGRIVVPAMRGA